ncbi:cell division protein FtsN [Caulobacter ginsengisoli]|uniref:Cell division protein FtsN n=1 Tax=Caulobacter ginsengisoli TaxID=400775 RepID=A0ABU0IPB5_9CAUL|nr:SPOR domain-containing protein [Caulobacter ginsengisoli]MDQ0463804.1 cell division protein FtsN [Caulobacter ginsengisoli]
MSDQERGAYTPRNEAPLAFDARRPVRGGGPMPVTLVVSAVILLVLAGGFFFIYRDGLRGANDAPKPVGTVVADARTAPKGDDTPEDPSTGLQIYNQETGQTVSGAPTLAAPPEEPMSRPTPRPTEPVQTAQLKPPAPKPAAGPVAAQPASPVEQMAQQVTKPTPVKPPVAAPTPEPRQSGGAMAMVQIGAFTSPALADKGWNDAAAIAPGAAAGKGKKVETIVKDGVTLYRTLVTGFPSRAEASAFCDRLKAASKNCFVK